MRLIRVLSSPQLPGPFASPVARSVERWTPCGGSTYPVAKLRGSRRDKCSMFTSLKAGNIIGKVILGMIAVGDRP